MATVKPLPGNAFPLGSHYDAKLFGRIVERQY